MASRWVRAGVGLGARVLLLPASRLLRAASGRVRSSATATAGLLRARSVLWLDDQVAAFGFVHIRGNMTARRAMAIDTFNRRATADRLPASITAMQVDIAPRRCIGAGDERSCALDQ